jgi:hypothetical protein
MPIRVECPRCQRQAFFADNDAGLAVACLGCGQHLRVPAAAPRPAPVIKSLSPDEPPPLFANTPAHLLATPPQQSEAPATPPPAARKPSRPLRPAGPRPHWRAFGLLFLLLGSATLLIQWLRHRPTRAIAPRIASVQPAASRPSLNSTPRAVASKTPAAPATAPVGRSKRPVLASSASPQAAVAPVVVPVPLPTYTPAAAPVGFIGFERVEIGGRFHVDSYDASTETYAPENAHGAALLLSNGPIRLGDSGDVQGDVRSADGSVVQTTHHRHVTGQTAPLHHRLRAAPVALNPYAHDSANDALPAKLFKNGNLVLSRNQHLSLPPGVYYLNDLTIQAPATLHLQGATTLLISGRLNVTGTIETPASRPANCHIRVTGAQPVSITHDNTLYLDLYAPASHIDISGNGDVYGSVVGKTLRVSGKRPLHFDESLLPH